MKRTTGWLLLTLALLTGGVRAEKQWAEFIERDHPFFCHVLDAREIQGDWPEVVRQNLTPRGILMNVGHGYWVCFDPDLLRISLVWKERRPDSVITLNGMAPGSWHEVSRKAPGGQDALPQPVGKPHLANGIYPGWYGGDVPGQLFDPRPDPADPEEVGRGPVTPEFMRWNGIRVGDYHMSLHYEVGDAEIEERWQWSEEGLKRVLIVQPHEDTLNVMHGYRDGGDMLMSNILSSDAVEVHAEVIVPMGGMNAVAIPTKNVIDPEIEVPGVVGEPTESKAQPYVIDEVPLPTDNPWRRNVRFSGMDFFSDGRAALSTFDGDVWIADGIEGDLSEVTWRRFAAGLNEAMALRIMDDEIYVHGRTCIWKLQDTDGDGACDFYENFCNLMGQTAETREFPNDMVKDGKGGFFIAKPGQLAKSRGHHNGHILRISPDGRSIESVASGFRQPYIGYDAETDLLTASDQQGHWVPSTPIHVVKQGDWYGHIAPFLDEQPAPIVEPPLWIPHFVNQSGASQITNRDERWGPLADDLIHIAFNRPELFRVYLDEGQGAIAPLLSGFGTGTLKAAVNPTDGQLYVVGFRIWGTVAEDVTGFYRVRYTGEGVLEAPEMVKSEERGILMRFEFPVEESIATALSSYEVDRWNYQRSAAYGSGHYTLDGKPGLQAMPVASAYISEDGHSVFLGIPDMKPVDQIRVTYRLPLASEDGLPQIRSCYLTVRELRSLDLAEEGFGDLKVNLTPPAPVAGEKKDPSVEEGELLYTMAGCAGCHSIDGSQAEKPGPTFRGLYGSKREFIDGGLIRNADEVYMRESILDPTRRTVVGFNGEDVLMPSYLGILKDHQVDSLILYIKSLKAKKKS